jgi:hypothetical protein
MAPTESSLPESAAFVSGVSKAEIARLSGIARTTVDRILDSEADGPDPAPEA